MIVLDSWRKRNNSLNIIRKMIKSWAWFKISIHYFTSKLLIAKLDLDQNHLDRRGVQYLSDVLRQDVLSTIILLSHPWVVIFSQTLKTLNLHENGIGDVGAEFIADVLKQNKVSATIFSHILYLSIFYMLIDTYVIRSWYE